MDRKIAILEALTSSDKPLTSTQLASMIEVSSRTVREDIKDLNWQLSRNGAKIQAYKGKGFSLLIQDNSLFNRFFKKFNQPYGMNIHHPQTPSERIRYLLDIFLRGHFPIKLDDLCELIHVSRSTIQSDLKSVKKLIEQYDLHLVSRPNYGLYLKGTELNKRFAISEYLFNYDKAGPNLIQLDQISSISKISKTTSRKIWSILLEQIDQNDIILSDIALNNLFVHIVIAYKRIKEGYNIQLVEKDLSEIKSQREYIVAKVMIKRMEAVLKVDFPSIEVAYVAIHLLGTKLIPALPEKVESFDQIIDRSIQNLVMEILNELKNELNIDLILDKELMMSLALHLKPAINRYKFNMNIRNPMLEDIKAHYPLAFEAGIIASYVIKKVLSVEIDEHEAAYIALHIGAALERNKEKEQSKRCYIVCASGVGSSKLIQYKLQSRFGTAIEVIGTAELYRINEIPFQEIDFIISAVPINQKLLVPMIEVNTIISEADLKKIDQFIIGEEQGLNEFIDENHTFLNLHLSTKEDVFKFLYNQLSQMHELPEFYLERLEEREEIAPTSYGNLVAIPHPIAPQTEETFLTFCTLKHPIQWGEKKVQFICLLNVEKNSQEDLQLLYKVLGNIVSTPSVIQNLLQSSTYKGFSNILHSLT